MTINRCGDCVHGKIVPSDLKVRICRGGPPQVILLPGPRGAPEVKAMYPLVGALEEGCGRFEKKSAIDTPEGTA